MKGADDPLRRYHRALTRVARPPPKKAEGLLCLLPILACAAAGGAPQRAVPVAVAWHLFRRASGLLDHAQDGDPFPSGLRQGDKGVGRQGDLRLANLRPCRKSPCRPVSPSPCLTTGDGSVSQAVNLATGLLLAGQLALSHLPHYGVSPQRALSIIADFNATALRACAGQHADLASGQPSLEACRQALALRAGEPFALACRAGAALATHDQPLIALCHEFGYNLGALWQLADDFDDLWNPHGPSDLALGKRTLPVVYALTAAQPPEGERLEALLQRAADGDGEAEAVARQRITALGAPLYVVAQAQIHRGRAGAALRQLSGPPVVQAHLRALLDRAMPALATENHG